MHRLNSRDGVALLVSQLLERRSLRHDGLVYALPVVNVLTPSPQLLERSLTLAYGRRVVEVPRTLAVRHAGLRLVLRHVVAQAALFGQILLRLGLRLGVAFFFFFLLQGLYYAVDGLVALRLGHLGEGLERVLQMHGIGVRHQLVKHFGTVGQLFIVVALLFQQPDGFTVTTPCVAVILAFPIQVAELKQQNALLYAVARRLDVALFVGGDGIQGVFLVKVYVADSVIYLVKILLVVVRPGHALELFYHLSRLASGHNLGHCDACVEGKFVWRT